MPIWESSRKANSRVTAAACQEKVKSPDLPANLALKIPLALVIRVRVQAPGRNRDSARPTQRAAEEEGFPT